jgi:peptidoglycan/xylan/chitin deacetylase (PgdA/CDA1 family)
VKKEILRTIDASLSITGMAHLYAHIADCDGAIMLMYHSVAGPETAPFIDPRNHLPPMLLRQQLAYLRARRRVISLDDLVNSLEAGETPPRGTVVITFDDGYLDNLTIAAPILAEFELPATLYLATAYIDAAENQWIDEAYTCFAFRSRHTYQPPTESRALNLTQPAMAHRAYQQLCASLLSTSRTTRTERLADARDQLQPTRTAPRLTLSWDDVRRMQRDYPLFALGAHTHGHLDLSATDPEQAAADLHQCTETIHRETGARPRHFSYPYGRRLAGFDKNLHMCQYRSAVATGSEPLLRPGSDLFALARVEAPASAARFRYYTSGAYPGLSRRLTGRPR